MQGTLDNLIVVKRSGQRVTFNGAKIAVAIKYAFDSVYEKYDEKEVNKVYKEVLDYINSEYQNRKTINVEDIQDVIEKTLQRKSFTDVYLSFNEYRLRRAASREVFSVKQQHKFVKGIEKIGLTVKNSKDDKPIDLLYNFGKIISKEFTNAYLLDSKYVRAEEEGIIGIGNLESYAFATTSSSHLDFNWIKEKSLETYTDVLLDKIYHYKEEQYGEHTIPLLDTLYKPILLSSFQEIYEILLLQYLKLEGFYELIEIETIKKWIFEITSITGLPDNIPIQTNEKIKNIFTFAYKQAYEMIQRRLYDCMIKLLQKLENMKIKMNNCFVSISIGSDITPDGLLIQKTYLDALESLKTLEKVNTIYKIGNKVPYIEKVRDLIIQRKNIACFYVNEMENNQEVFSTGAYIYDNINGDVSTSIGRILVSSSSVNLARLGLKHKIENMDAFYEELEDMLEFCKNQLLQRFEIQANKYKENYEYLFQDEVLYDSKKLEIGQKVRKIIRHGALEIGYVGLGECICALQNKSNLNEKDIDLGYDILNFIKEKVQKFTKDNKLNFIVCETIDSKICKSMLAIDKSLYGTVDILKKKEYQPFFKMLQTSKMDMEKWLEIESKMQKISDMVAFVSVPKNYSSKKLLELLHMAQNKQVRYMKVRVGKDED